jgi:taurine dioxygenase
MGTMLRALITPRPGGDTVFTSMSAAYDGLSDRMQHFISGMEAVHDFKPFRQLFESDPESRKDLQFFETKYPPAIHPIVREHPVSKRKVLFVNPQFTIAVKGMDERESRSLLDTLFQQTLVPEYQHRVQWRPNTLVFWDNRSVQHYAVHDYYPLRPRRPPGLATPRPHRRWPRRYGSATCCSCPARARSTRKPARLSMSRISPSRPFRP